MRAHASVIFRSCGGHGRNLFDTDEEVGLRWFFTNSYSDDGQKSCGSCHWQSRSDGSQWNVGANAIGGPKICPQNKDISDNWPEWFEGLNNNMSAYASACNGELVQAEKVTALFPQPVLADRLAAREAYVQRQTAANSNAIGRSELSGKAHDRLGRDKVGSRSRATSASPAFRFPAA